MLFGNFPALQDVELMASKKALTGSQYKPIDVVGEFRPNVSLLN